MLETDNTQNAVVAIAQQILQAPSQEKKNHLSNQQQEVLKTVSEFCDQQDILEHIKNLDLLLNQFMESEEFKVFGQDSISSVVYSATTVKTYLMELESKNNRLQAAK